MIGKRILLTGARGFIGRHCVEPLRARGYEIHAVTSQEPAATPGGVYWHRTDLLNGEEVRRLVATVRPTHALHLAWIATPGVYWTSRDNLRWAATGIELAHALADHGARRIVGAGTCAEYDWRQGHCDERATPCAPATLYGASKHALRLALDLAGAETGISTAWGRVFFLYGPGEHPKRLVPTVVRALLESERALCSAGTQVRDVLYVKDVADAFAALVDSEARGPVNIASGSAIAVKDLAFAVADRLGRRHLIQLGSPVDEPPVLTASIERLYQEVGWRPKYDLMAGVAETVEWWQQERRR